MEPARDAAMKSRWRGSRSSRSRNIASIVRTKRTLKLAAVKVDWSSRSPSDGPGAEELSGADDSEEHAEPVRSADDDVQVDSAFGPDEDELEATGVEKRRRGRPPKAKKAGVQKKMR
jgi:hypothetical protein